MIQFLLNLKNGIGIWYLVPVTSGMFLTNERQEFSIKFLLKVRNFAENWTNCKEIVHIPQNMDYISTLVDNMSFVTDWMPLNQPLGGYI